MSDVQAPDRQKNVERESDRDGKGRGQSGSIVDDDKLITGEDQFADPTVLSRLINSVSHALQTESRFGHGILWVPVAMAVGAALWFVADPEPGFLPLILLFVLLAVGCRLLRDYPAWRAIGVLSCGVLIGMMAASVESRRAGTTLLDGPVTTRIEGTVLARDVDHRQRWRYTVRLTRTKDPNIGRPPERIRVLARSRHDPIEVGEGISGLARLQPPSGPALEGGYDFAFNAYFQGLGAVGYFYGRPDPLTAETERPDGNLKDKFTAALARFREQIAFRIRAALPGDTGAFASALAVADRRAMSPGSVEALRASGLAHVLAISGLHMALVAGGVFFALRGAASLFPTAAQAFPVKKIAAAVSLLVATAYLLISGASVSTQRAWLMLAIVLIAVMVDRPALTLRNVALAAICIILITPSAVLGPGFQMSFAATAALVAAYAWWRERPSSISASVGGSGIVRLIVLFFIGLAVTSLVAGLATAPFATYHFHRTAVFGLIANLAAMPIVTLVVMPTGLLSVLVMPLGLEYWPLQLMGVGLSGVLSVARFVQNLGGYVTIGRIPDIAIIALTAGFLILVLMRSWLRVTGLLLIAATLVALFILPPNQEPMILISEDGRQVALVGEDMLATTRARPSKFIFEQWQRALRRGVHVRPQRVTPQSDSVAIDHLEWNSNEHTGKATPEFRCIKDQFCLGYTVSGESVAVVEDLTLLGAACDRADFVIVSRAIHMSACRSGALLITGRMLRKTGAVEIYGSGAGHAPRVVASVTQKNRPWTVHRYYDWRSRSFDFGRPAWSEP